MNTIPPKWISLVDEIKAEISKIEKKLRELGNLHSDHLLVGFGEEDGDKEQNIQILTAEITQRFHGANKKLKTLVRPAPTTSEEAREDQLRKNVRATLANQLQQLSLEFRRKQRGRRIFFIETNINTCNCSSLEYLEKVRGRQFQTSDLFIADNQQSVCFFHVPLYLWTDTLSKNPFDEIGFSEEQLQNVALNQSRYNQRSQEIQGIVQSITELAEITNDLRSLVVDQGTILDRIDYNIEQVHLLVKEGEDTVIDFNKNSQNSRKKIFILGLCVTVFILCLLLIIKFLWRSLQ
jgi:syntaxin 16